MGLLTIGDTMSIAILIISALIILFGRIILR